MIAPLAHDWLPLESWLEERERSEPREESLAYQFGEVCGKIVGCAPAALAQTGILTDENLSRVFAPPIEFVACRRCHVALTRGWLELLRELGKAQLCAGRPPA